MNRKGTQDLKPPLNLPLYSDKELAKVVMGSSWSPFSYKAIQAAIRAGELKARKINRKWMILESEAKDWLSYRNGR